MNADRDTSAGGSRKSLNNHYDSSSFEAKDWVKTILKKARYSQPFNRVATSTARSLLTAAGWSSEFVIKYLHRVGTVESELPNGRVLRLRSHGDDWVSNQLYWRGWSGYEPESVPLFFRLAARAGVTLDVGSYVGFYTLLAAHANPAGRVYAFEPLPAIYQRLCSNVALNGLANVRCINSAVGEEEGTAEFFHVDVELPTSSSLSYNFMKSAEGLRSSHVPVTTLDRFVGENSVGRVDLVKIDTETTEPQVLRGMTEIIRRDQPIILCEVLPGRGVEKELEDVLSALGYNYYHLTPESPVPCERIKGHHEWLNYLFTVLKPEDVAQL